MIPSAHILLTATQSSLWTNDLEHMGLKRSGKRKAAKAGRVRSSDRQQREFLGDGPLRGEWVCPFCGRWCSRRRNGAMHHLRFCKKNSATHSPQPPNTNTEIEPATAPVVSRRQSFPDYEDVTGSSSASETYADPNMSTASESDIGPRHRRRARGFRHVSSSSSQGNIYYY